MIREATMADGLDSSDAKIDELCDAFEAAWRRGNRPQISEFLALAAEELRSRLFYELLLVELELRREAGEQPSQAEYLGRFPEFGREIESVAFSYGGSAFSAPQGNFEAALGCEAHKKGDRISHYQLVDKIGEGAMGEVWKATDARLNRPVAIKLPRSQTLTEDELKRFLREGQAVGQLKHPQLAAVHDIGRWGNSAYIVVDYVEGENLRTRILRGKLSQREIVDICADVAEALHHAHERGVVHRDLKPANIIVDPHGRSHVIDFGLAKWVTDERDLTLHGELLGTPAYMSPEQARGEGSKAGPATDIYSLGAVLYEMLTGACPFTGGHASVLHQIANATPVSPRQKIANVPRDLETISLKALEKDPKQRYGTIQEMAVDLRRFGRGEPILSRRPGLIERSWHWGRRHPGLAAAVLIVAIVVSISGAVIRSLIAKNYQLQGYRHVLVESSPGGAHVAFVPISKRTDEPDPNPAGIVRCVTPSRIWLKPGNYFEECVVTRQDGVIDLSEEYTTIPEAGMLPEILKSDLQRQQEREGNEELYECRTTIQPREKVVSNMIAIPISETVRRGNPLLPSLLYVDREVTLPTSYPKLEANSVESPRLKLSGKFISLKQAISWLQDSGKRLPSALDSEIIEKTIADGIELRNGSGRALSLEDGPDPSAIWTSTKYEFPGIASQDDLLKLQRQHVLLVTGDPDSISGATRSADGKTIAPPNAESKYIGFRGVLSGTPRFQKP